MAKNIRELAEKASNALDRLEQACADINPNFELKDSLDGALELTDIARSLTESDFLEQFEEHPYTVTVWIANPYTVTVNALNADAACEKVEDNPHGFQYTPKGEYGYSGLTENVLREHPWEPTVE